MTIFNLPKEAADLSLIDIGKKTETVSTNGLKMLFPFGTHDVGLLRSKVQPLGKSIQTMNFFLWSKEKLR